MTETDSQRAGHNDGQRSDSMRWLECVEQMKSEAALMTPEELACPWTKPRTMRGLRVSMLYITALLFAVLEGEAKHSNDQDQA